MEISDLLSGVAIIVSIVAIIASYRSSKLLNSLSVAKLKKEINRLESADIRINIIYKRYYKKGVSAGDTYKFEIINIGNSPAKEINIFDKLIFEGIDAHWELENWDESIISKPKFPISIIKPGSTFSFYFTINILKFVNKTMTVEWSDINDHRHREEVYIEIIDSDIHY